MAKPEILNMNIRSKARKRFLCLDCGVDTFRIGEFYMLRDSTWLKANPADNGMLCINCLEKRLVRSLTRGDFDLELSLNKVAVFHSGKIARILHFKGRELLDAAEIHYYWCAGECWFEGNREPGSGQWSRLKSWHGSNKR